MVIVKKPGYKFAINILSDIVASICEREKKLDLILLANYIDHYRAHLKLSAEALELEKNVIEFDMFITDQTLLDLATAYIAQEANENVAPLKAL